MRFVEVESTCCTSIMSSTEVPHLAVQLDLLLFLRIVFCSKSCPFERAVLLKPSKLRTTITFRPEGVGRCRLVCLKEDDFLYKNFASDYNLDGTFRVVSGCNG